MPEIDAQGFDAQKLAANYADGVNRAEIRFFPYKFGEPYWDIDEEIIDCLDLQGNEAVCDVGSGPGEFAFSMRGRTYNHQGELTCVEPHLAQHPHSLMSGSLGVTFVQAWAHDLSQIKTGTQDVTTLRMAAYHMPEAERRKAISEMKRVTKPEDGRNIISTSEDYNKIRLRGLEAYKARRLSELTGIKHEKPAYMNSGWDAETGQSELPTLYNQVLMRVLRSTMVIDKPYKVAAVMAALRTQNNQFDPQLPEYPESTEVIDVVDNEIETIIKNEITERGRWIDYIGRVFFVCSDSKSPILLANRRDFTDISLR